VLCFEVNGKTESVQSDQGQTERGELNIRESGRNAGNEGVKERIVAALLRGRPEKETNVFGRPWRSKEGRRLIGGRRGALAIFEF